MQRAGGPVRRRGRIGGGGGWTRGIGKIFRLFRPLPRAGLRGCFVLFRTSPPCRCSAPSNPFQDLTISNAKRTSEIVSSEFEKQDLLRFCYLDGNSFSWP